MSVQVAATTLLGTRDRNDDRAVLAGPLLAMADGGGSHGGLIADAVIAMVLSDTSRWGEAPLDDSFSLFSSVHAEIAAKVSGGARGDATLTVVHVASNSTGGATITIRWIGDGVLASTDTSLDDALDRASAVASVHRSRIGRHVTAVGFQVFSARVGTRLMVATDGMRCVSRALTRDILRTAHSAHQCIDDLMRAAKGAATDNITVGVVEVSGG